MAVVQVTWVCPHCGEELLVIAEQNYSGPARRRGGRPAGSKNRPKDEPAPKAAAVGLVKGGE